MADETRDANVRLSADVEPYRQPVQAATQDTEKMAAAVDALASSLDGLGRRVSKKLTLFAAADLAMVSSMVAVTGQLQKQLDTLSGSAAVTNRSMGPLTTSIRQMSRELPVARGEIAALTTSISKMGVTSTRDLTGFTDTFLKASRATGDSATGLASSMTALSRQMGTLGGGNAQMKNFTDSLVQVSSAAGVSAQNVADFANSIAPFARVAGMGQKQVLGLSAAFVQAGNDGYAAANTFNTMLADIVRQTSNGGPGLAKYASLVGTTVDQFKKLDSSQQVVKIFSAINDAGPQAVQVLDQMGFDGIRAAKAIQTMAAQSGGLEKLINTAVSGYGGGATEKGAAAAMSGLNDELQRAGNIAQDMATSIGAGMIGPFTAALNVVNNIGAELAKMTGAFSAGGVLAGVAGIGAGVAGGVGTLASLAAVPAAIGFIRRSSPVQAFQEGRQAGFARQNGLPIPQGPYAGRAGVVGGFYSSGAAIGAAMPAGGVGPGLLARAAGLPFRVGTSFANFQQQFYADSMKDGNQRGNTNLLRSLGAAATSTERLAVSSGKAALAVAKLEMTAAKSAVVNTAQVAGMGLKSAGGALMGFLGGPVGLGILAGATALQVKGMNDERSDELRSRDASYFTLSSAYNAELGKATTAVSGFADGLGAAAVKVTNLSEAIDQAKGAPNRPTPVGTSAVGIQNPEQGAAYLRALGTNDPEVLKSAFIDVRSVLGPAGGNQAIDAYARGGPATLNDVGTLARGIDTAGTAGFMDWLKEQSGIGGLGELSDSAIKNTIGAASNYVGGVRDRYGDDAANQARILAVQQILDEVGKNPQANGKRRDELFTQLETFSGLKLNPGQDKYYGTFTGQDILGGLGADANLGAGVKLGAAGQANLDSLMKTSENPTLVALRRRGYDLTSGNGILERSTTQVGDADLQAQATVELYNRAKRNVKLTAAQRRAGVTAADLAGSNLQGVIAEIPTADMTRGSLNTRAREAQGLLDVDRQFQGVYQTRSQRVASSQARYQAAVNAPRTGDYTQNVIGAKQDLEAQKAQYAQYLMGLVQAQENFQITMRRSEVDYYRQRRYSYQDFATSMGRAQADFNKSTRRSQEDFQTSLKRQGEDTAKSIYNPFRRVYSEYTTDVGTLKQNMGDQTRRIRDQVKNLRKLKRLGLTQQTIDMLDLANPANAQQAEELAQEMTRGDAATLNRQSRSRQRATNELTQSDLSQQYRRANADFRKQMNRASSDFETSISRANADFNKGLGRMAEARKTQMARAKQDLDRMGREQAASFETLFTKAVALVTKNIGKASGATIAELARVRAEFPELFPTSAAPAPAKPRSVPGGARNADRAAGDVTSTTYNIRTLEVKASDPKDFTRELARENAKRKLKGMKSAG